MVRNIGKNLDSNNFQTKIKQDGYFQSPREFRNFREYTSKVWNTVSTTNTAQFLSKDVWYQQPSVLTEKGYYLIRTDERSFVIFDENVFPSPYLDLKIENPEYLYTLEPYGYEHLKKAFGENIIENTALEQLRFNGVYEKIINDISGEKQQYYVGIRGNTTRTFNVYFKKKNENEPILIYQYKG